MLYRIPHPLTAVRSTSSKKAKIMTHRRPALNPSLRLVEQMRFCTDERLALMYRLWWPDIDSAGKNTGLLKPDTKIHCSFQMKLLPRHMLLQWKCNKMGRLQTLFSVCTFSLKGYLFCVGIEGSGIVLLCP